MKRVGRNGHLLNVGVIRFPGSNCDVDCAEAFSSHFSAAIHMIWHSETDLPPVDLIVLPGGFSFGDYLRSGALAARAPVMQAVGRFVRRGGHVIGICNGFQILTESGLLPGSLLGNLSQKFICKEVFVRSGSGDVLTLPIAHAEGRYWISEEQLTSLEGNGQIAYQYCSREGQVTMDNNPNGSVANIAGVYSKARNVLGLMPHPERAVESFTGKKPDGISIIADFLRDI
jgi:phosphoribosylformylglycinamidine synthase I